MKSFQGSPLNLNSPVIGKVSKTPYEFSLRRDQVYVSESLSMGLWGYLGIITARQDKNKKIPSNIPCILGLSSEEITQLTEGSIVLLEPNGRVQVLWDTANIDNSILATESCNCKCIICPQPNREDSENLFEQNMRLLRLLDPKTVTQIGITGGEPTLIGDKLCTILDLCRDRFPEAMVSLLTNGRRFKDFEFARTIAKVNHPNLICCVSLYSDTDTEHDHIVQAPGSFNETIKGLHNLALFQVKVEIRTVIFTKNYRRLPALAEFIYRNFPFVIHVALMGLECTGLAKTNLEQIWIEPVEYAAELASAVLALNQRAIYVSIYNLPLCLLPKKLWRFGRKSISSWKNIYLPQCGECQVKPQCCGLFATSELQSRHISPLRNVVL